MTGTHVVAVRLPDGRLLIAVFDPTTPHQHSPLRRHLRNETTRTPKDRKPSPC